MANLALITQALDDGSAAAQRARPVLGMEVATLRDILEDTSSAADRLRRIVADLRSFTQPPEEHDAPVNLARALRRALQSTAHEFRHRARVSVDLRDMPDIDASEVRLGQVFVNLLVNSAHAITPGRAQDNRVEVRAYRDEQGWAAVEVHDTGERHPRRGAPAHLRSVLHHQAAGHGQRAGAVGLPRHREVAGRRDHVRRARSAGGPCSGSALPPTPAAARGRAGAPTRARAPSPSGPASWSSTTSRWCGGRSSASLDKEHDVISAATAAEALERLQAGERFDLILCDLMMPEMTGMEMAARLRAGSAGGVRAPGVPVGRRVHPRGGRIFAFGGQPLHRETVSSRGPAAARSATAGRTWPVRAPAGLAVV